MPKIRQALILRVPDPARPKHDGCVTVTEQRETVLLTVREAGSSIDKTQQLTIAEARTLADHLSRICRRIRDRKPYRP